MQLQRRLPGASGWSTEGQFAPSQIKLIYGAAATLAGVFGYAWRITNTEGRVLSVYSGGRWVDNHAVIAGAQFWATDAPVTSPGRLDAFADTVQLHRKE